MNSSDNDDRHDESIKAALSRLAGSYRPALTSERLVAARRRRSRTYGMAAAALSVAVIAVAGALALNISRSGTQLSVAAPVSDAVTETPPQTLATDLATAAPTRGTQATFPAASPTSRTSAAANQSRVSTPASHALTSQGRTTGRRAPTVLHSTAASSTKIPACATGQLRITVQEWGFTMPGNVANIAFRNIGSTACTLTGWPTVQVVGPDGRTPVTTRLTYSRSDGEVGVVPVAPVVLSPGNTVEASLMIWDPGGGCAGRSFTWIITPPGARTAVRIPQDYQGNKFNIFEICSARTSIEITPVRL